MKNRLPLSVRKSPKNPIVDNYFIIDSINSIKTTSKDCAYISKDKKSLYVQRRGRLYKVNSRAPLTQVGKNAVLYMYTYREIPTKDFNIVSQNNRGYYSGIGNYFCTLSRASLLRLQEKEAEYLLFPTL